MTIRQRLSLALGVRRPGALRRRRARAGRRSRSARSTAIPALPAFTEPYRKGWQLAVEEINAAGGIGGKKLVVVSKDDGGKPGRRGDGRQRARRAREASPCSPAGFFSNIGLAVADLRQAAEDVLPRRRAADRRASSGRPATATPSACGPRNYMQAAMLAEEAAKLPAKTLGDDRAELRIRPVGRDGVQGAALGEAARTSSGSAEQWPPQGKIDAGADGRRRSPPPSPTRSSTSPSAPTS